jgi:hypothetical protein
MTTQTITKLEAARRQLDTAINLWFMDGDAVSVHTLAAAAHGIIHDLNRVKKGPPLLFDSPTIDAQFKKEAIRILKSFENFCKHADLRKQKETEMEFDSEVTIGFIFACLYGVAFLGYHLNGVELAFRSWVWVNRPQFLNYQLKKTVADRIEIKRLETLRIIPKGEFLKHFLKVSRV